MIDFLRRAAVVLLVSLVYLQVVLGLLPAEKIHTPRYRRPWGLQAATVRRFGPRVLAFRVQVMIV